MDIRIYVGNLPKTTTQEELTAMFAKAGAVSGAEVVMDKGTGLSKGFAFVTMANQDEADKAITMFNAHKLGENELKVNIAKPRA